MINDVDVVVLNVKLFVYDLVCLVLVEGFLVLELFDKIKVLFV